MNNPRPGAAPAAIQPFWQRLSTICAYPLQANAFSTLALLAVGRLVVYVPGIGWFLDILVTVAILRYAGEVLYRTAQGRMDAPTGYNADEERGWILFRVQVALFALALLGAFVGKAMEAPFIGIAVMLLVGLGTPGALISAAIDGDWVRALNPLLWLQVMARLGMPYLLLSGLCLLISLSESNAQAMLVPLMPAAFALVVYYLIAHYALVATFHLMGYTVYQYHELLGFEVDEGWAPLVKAADRDQEVLAQAEALAADGELKVAEALLAEHIRERGGTDEIRQRHRKLLRLRNDTAALLTDGRDWINVMLARDDDKRALELWRECRELDPAFWPSDPTQVQRLARKAADLGHSELALKTTVGFHKAFPKHRDIVPNYLLAARLLVDRFGQDAKALELLRQLQQGFPQHAQAEEVTAYAKVVENLVATATPKPRRTP
jgi:hypothetical protein